MKEDDLIWVMVCKSGTTKYSPDTLKGKPALAKIGHIVTNDSGTFGAGLEWFDPRHESLPGAVLEEVDKFVVMSPDNPNVPDEAWAKLAEIRLSE